jgi:hypothetical protein
MSVITRWALGALAIGAAATALTGCSNQQQDASPAASSASQQTGTATAAPSHPVEATASVSGACTSAHVKATLGKLTTLTPGQNTQPVTVTNTSGAPCTLNGFPDVDLVGTGENVVGTTGASPNYKWTLQHSSAAAATITLPPGGAGSFDITYLADAGGDPVLKVDSIQLTLPGDSAHTAVAWNAAVMLQDMATHPGTYSGPFAAAH